MPSPRHDWNPELYARFGDERLQPALDLLALLEPARDACAVDLGCGDGSVTALLHATLGEDAQVAGIDNSPAMLDRAAAHVADSRWFEQGDIAQWSADACHDVIFSNAALHWVEDHPALLARLRDALAPGGQLAVQVPRNGAHASQQAVAWAAAQPPFAEALGGWVHRSPVLDPAQYALLLARLGFERQRVELRVYLHRLATREEAIAWMEGSLMVAYRQRLDEATYRAFVDAVRARFLETTEEERPYLYTFERVLLWGRMGKGQ